MSLGNSTPQLMISPVLSGREVELRELQPEYIDELSRLAQDKRIWEHYVFDGTSERKFRAAMESALIQKAKGTQFPYVVVRRADEQLVGSTRFLDIQPEHRKLEIGWTWLHPSVWSSRVNPECKLLLLNHCFNDLRLVRVQLKTDENNIRSRKAIEKLGARFEGVLRHDMLRENGTNRNSAYYSILDSEWPEVQRRIEGQLA